MAGGRWVASANINRNLESLRREFREWYEHGIPEVLPWWKRWLGFKPKRTKLPTEYRALFKPVEK